MRDVLRVDLVTRYWRSYLFVVVATLLAHAVWLMVWGIAPSTDFSVRYDPAAKQLLALAGVPGFEVDPALSFSTFGGMRIGYPVFMAVGYALFGPSLGAAVYPQLAIVWLVYPLMFHFLLHVTRRHWLSLGAMCVWLSYYDGYQWQFWGLPDALYRLMFVATVFLLVRFWETGRHGPFVWTTVIATIVGTVFRIETPLYALPAWGFVFSLVYQTHRKALLAAAVAAAGLLWVGRYLLLDIGILFVQMQKEGRVLPGSGQDIPGLTSLAHPSGTSVWNWAVFFAHLGANRLWYATTPLPALWSQSHRLYYAAYLMVAYLFVVCGIVAGCYRQDRRFLIFLWVFVAGVLLQVLVAVDPSMRYGYTAQVFLFFCAVMGAQAIYPWVMRKLSVDSRFVKSPPQRV